MSETNTKKLLLPEIVSEYINFNAECENYRYSKDESMFAKQYEGVAYLWNLLETKKIALLADEVGTGKTYQALGVLITLLKIKPDARCLIIAPRYQVAMNWIREYHNFVSMHYKLLDDQIKSSITHSAIPTIQYCHNLEEVVSKSEYGQIFVAKTTMFSYLGSDEEKKNKKEIAKLAFEKGKKYREDIKKKYDLLIIDEAHYYRNFDGDSLRVNAAKGFFGTINEENYSAEKDAAIASKVLLITATPNYSRETDIKNIFRYFNYLGIYLDKYREYTELLKAFGLRRFRRLENKIKYQYREEKVIEASFSKDLKAEMFFAIYQKHLVRKILGEKENGQKKGKKENISENRLTFGYLEGCEIISLEKNSSEEDEDSTENNEKSKNKLDGHDYSHGLDHEILKEIVNKYVVFFDKPPSHPKYDKIINNIIKKEFEKNIIFVRRIPSVKELTERLLREYDKILFKKLRKNLDFPEDIEKPNTREKLNYLIREHFPEFAKKDENKVSESNDNSNFKNSIVLDYFVTKKEQQSSTLGSNFKKLLLNSNSPLSILFELPPNREKPTEAYEFGKVFVNKGENRDYIDYLETAKKERYSKYIKLQYYAKYPCKINANRKFDTLWTLFFDENKNAHKKINSFSECEWEGLGNFTKKALIFASDSIIELFCWYLKNKKDDYEKLMGIIKNDFANSRTYFLMKESLEHFRYIYQKVLGLKEEELPDYNFRIFESALPVYGFHGATKSDTIIKLFNTPFYPNNIIATSVLQEGVNLHYYCNNVIHYGVAWTHGADEQRNGRVDRFFGKVHRKIRIKNDSSAMNICYPVLKDSIDELQVSQFIKYKRRAESLIDRGEIPKEVTKVDNKFESNWERYLLKPDNNSDKLEDPYPAKFEGIESKFLKINNRRVYGKNIITSILTYLNKCRKINNIEIKEIRKFWSENNPTSKLFYLNAEISEEDKKRHQPAMVFCGFLPLLLATDFNKEIFSFYLKIISPVAKQNDILKKFFIGEHPNFQEELKEKLVDYPLVKIEIDDDKVGFEYFTCCSYVLISFDSEGNVFLDENELKNSIEQTLYVADELEKMINGEKDNAEFEEISILENEKKDSISDELCFNIYLKNQKNDYISDNWNEFERKNFKYVSKEFSFETNIDYINCVKKLSKYPFIGCYFETNNKVVIQLNYLKENFQKEEQRILENWFKIAESSIKNQLR